MSRSSTTLFSASELHAFTATGETPDHTLDVGRRLRSLREARRLTMRALAEASGLAVNTLSLIEHGKTSPSVSTLQQLAIALQVPISAFFEPDVPRSRVIFRKAEQYRTVPFSHGSLTDLGAGMTQRSFDPILLTLNPGAGSGDQAIAHPGQEFVFGLVGQITYIVLDQTYLIQPGDSLLFAATLPHQWKNTSEQPARALLVLCPYEVAGGSLAYHNHLGSS
ncbi:cupin domain-containing protein [Candidatus Viridilinea mediisalina]|uniref:Cupin n=1 Tax=Candidatus Viridilinea mediisalina TaxID=2024553 RepID=A0A2A6RK99_9CHLR|nr:cupin domain-containing protein [Candidatus Viridilinea mediisalina]PDW03309.1 cupin [Candidatus Viridilinea mediisalina]